jgi:tetratricopeptide (TPR) repeat protein
MRSLKLLAVFTSAAIVLIALLSSRAVADEQPRAPILVPNVQEPEEMRVAPLPMPKTISDPQDWTDYYDRGLAKLLSGFPYEAISDFTHAIKIEGRELLQSSVYEGRANAYMQTREWDLAIEDLTSAISLQTGGGLNVSQFRAIYPEYGAASDEAIAQKLNQTFYPDIKYEDFAEHFLTGRPVSSKVIPELYIKRSDAYLKKGDLRRALIDFRRVTNGFPDYAVGVDRWRQFGQTSDAHNYIDMTTFDDAPDGSVQLWIKQARGGNDGRSPYELFHFELNCNAEKIRTLSWAEYDASETLLRSGNGGKWGSIWPETLGKLLENGACSTANSG